VLARAQSRDFQPPAVAARRWRCRTLGATHTLPALLLAGALCSAGTSHAEPAQHPVNFSFFYPLSTNRDPMVETHFRLGILYGRVGAIHGVDLSGVVGRIHGEMSGFQVTGVATVNGGEFRGASVTGLLHYGGGDARGVQLSGLVNYGRGMFRGFQYASLFNYAEKDFVGVQLTSMYNLANADARYAQIASIVNIVSGSFRGLQASGGINYVQEEARGLQAGLFDYAHTIHGAQIALLNVAGTAHAAQLGAVNVARKNDVFALGLVSVANNGGADWVSFASNLAAINTGVRTSLLGFYSMFTLGVGDVQEERGDTAFLTWNYGYGFGLWRRWSLDTDLGFVHVMPQSSDDPAENDRLHYALQARALGEWRLSERTSVFGGAGLSTVFSEYSTTATTEIDPLVVLGVSLY